MENRPDGKVRKWLDNFKTHPRGRKVDGSGSGSCPVKGCGVSSGCSLSSAAIVSSFNWLSVLSGQNQDNVVKISSLDPMRYIASPLKKISDMLTV